MRSLRTRLIVGTTSVVAALLVVSGVTVHGLVRDGLTEELDRALEARARLLASAVEQDGDRIELDFDEIDMSEFAGAAAGGYLEVRRGREVLYRSPSLGDRRLEPFHVNPVWSWGVAPRGPVRSYSYRFRPRQDRPESGEAPVELDLVVARDGTPLNETLATLAMTLLAVGAGTVALVGIALALVVRRSLRSLDRVVADVAAIDAADPTGRVSRDGLPTELVPLVERLNDLLGRLQGALERERAFSGDVAHELRTPLAGLLATLEVAGSRERDPDEYVATIRSSVELVARLQGLVDRLLQLARLEALRPGEDAALAGPTEDVVALLVACWEPCARRAAERGIAVTFDLPDGPAVPLDADLARLVFGNLLENAVTHADDGGRIDVRVTLDDGLRVRVANTGSRVSADQARSATQRFWRGDAARSDAGLHCGLGLAVASRAARALGGRLDITSEPGGEFVANVRLPA